MLISCEKCSTTYVLDDALIPPQGAPVQCTRCQHVFTAKLPAPEAPPPPPSRPGSSTMMFGAPAAAAAAPAKNQTMMFGAPGGAAAAPPPSATPSSARATMVFGAPAVAPVVPPAAPSAKNQTMMFGAPAAVAPAPAAPSAKNQTMMFGTPASSAAAAPPAVAPAPAAPAAKNQTMMFGSAPVVPPVAAAAPAAKNQTMVFGTPASNAAAAAPAPAPASSKQTMVFGAAPVAPAPVRSPAPTFGTAASNAAAAGPTPAAPPPPASKTQLMGVPTEEPAGEETLMDLPGQSARTVLFGTAQPSAGAAPAPAPAPAAKNQTMMFGRAPVIPKVTAGTVELAGIAADEDQPNESTVRVDLQAEMTDEQAEAPAPRAEQEARHDRTQRFAMSDVGNGPTPPGGQSAVDARHNRTQLFAMSTVQDSTDAAGPALSAFAAEPLSAGMSMAGDTTLPPTSPERLERATVDLATTLPPDAQDPVLPMRGRQDPSGVSTLQDPDEGRMAFQEPVGPAPIATTLPNLAPLDLQRMQPLPLELPPEPQGSPRDLVAAQQRLQAQQDASATVQVPRSGGAGKAIVIVLAIIALALAGVLAWRLFGRQLLGKSANAEAIKSTEDALAGLRRDDSEAQEEAIARLRPLLAAHPELHEAQAAMVLAAALRFDDARALAQPDEKVAKALRVEAEGSGELAETARARLETLAPVLAKHRAEVDAHRAELMGQVQRLRALPALERGAPAEISVLRAEAIARGVLGEGEALALAERVRLLSGGTPDNWAALAGPELALNGGSSQEEALKELEVLRQRDSNSTFFRPYVLTARLRMQAGDDTQAAQELATVVSLNGKHLVAQRLLASLSSKN